MLSTLFLKIADDVFEFEFGKEEAIRSRTRFVEVELGNGLGIEVELGWDL